MKKYILMMIVMTLWAACDNEVTTPELVGKWQLKTVEKNGTETPVDTVWYNFQSESVFSVQVYVPLQDTVLVLLGFKKEENKVLSIRLESEAHLDRVDWSGQNRSFTIEKVNRKNLQLRSEEGYNYSFIKF